MENNEFEKAKIAYDEALLKENLENNFKDDVVKELQDTKESFNELKEIDEKNGSYVEDFDSIIDIINKCEIRSNKEVQRKREDGYIVGKYRDSIGVIGVISNSSLYPVIEIVLKAILTKNSVIVCTNDKLFVTIRYIITAIKTVLKKYGYPEDLVSVINSENYEEMYKHYNLINEIIVVGNKELQISAISKSKNKLVLSGYGCYDIYIEDILDIELIKKILKISNIELNIYINSNISKEDIEALGIEEYTEVETDDECIRDISINSAGYSSAIFTKNGENGNKFLKGVKTKNVFVNASPTMERKFDIDEQDMQVEKQVVYPSK